MISVGTVEFFEVLCQIREASVPNPSVICAERMVFDRGFHIPYPTAVHRVDDSCENRRSENDPAGNAGDRIACGVISKW
jgi:hypothetical protein